ncbi:predicted protein [Nematostella vectensis]|uniref:Uncharacterized protein n=1 Tax=Nematostella vectensis TaxID=45351 RepID=A7SRW7_NEMVE|nr:predicted protein [Nematostella vectensis]|eukprot:XP_001625636.1 predicted protein [Nematostella vectensis]
MAASHGLEGSLTLESLRKLWKDELLKDVRNEVKVAVIQLKEEMNLFRKKIDEIEASQKFLASQYDKVLSNLQGTNRSVQDMNANIQHVTQDLIETKEWLDELDSRLDEQQQYGRRDCLEFVGIPKVDNDDPVKLVIETAALAGVEVKEDDISIAHRLKPTKKGQDRIIAKFIRRSKRDEVYSNRKNLKQKRTKDLPTVRDQPAESGKTHHITVTSPRKSVSIDLTAYGIKNTNNIKYLGVFIDEHLKWNSQLNHVNKCLAKNLGIISKLRYFLPLTTLTQLYYNLIYPYISYGIMSWGSASQTRLRPIKTKQNKCIRSIFFAPQRESPSNYYQLLRILNLDNIHNLRISSLVYKLQHFPDTMPKPLCNLILPATQVHSHNTRYASKGNLFRPASKTNYGLTKFTAMSSRFWEKIPNCIKSLPYNSFIEQLKLHLLNNQN